MNNEPSKETMTLPITHDACPVCDSRKRLGASYIRQLKDEGILHKDCFNDGFVFQIPMVDPTRPPALLTTHMTIKVVMVYWDVCECGAIYCTKFTVANAPIQVQMQKQAGPGFPQGFGISKRSI